jgi:hypothetical protein
LTQNLTYKNYGNSNFDVRNAFKSYVVYDLPFGKGRQFLNNSLWADEILGGFQISGTFVVSSGNPFQVFANGNNTYQGTGAQFPNVIPGVSTKPQGGRNIKTWFNPAAFSDPGNGAFGNVARNSLYGPGFQEENMSALKSFNLPWERIKFSIRVDASNVFNHTSPGNPDGSLTGSSGVGTPYTATTNGAGSNQITGSNISGRDIQIGGRISF